MTRTYYVEIFCQADLTGQRIEEHLDEVMIASKKSQARPTSTSGQAWRQGTSTSAFTSKPKATQTPSARR